VAEFILPGSNRPIQLVGTVYNSSGEAVEGADVAVRLSDQTPGQDGAKEILFNTNGDGQFGVKLPPGQYVLKVSKEQSGPVEETITVEQNPAPLPATKLETLHKLEKEFRLP
jgi:flagellar hook assembly protein FlgD